LRTSAEGRRAGVRIQGLLPYRIAERLRTLPLVGRTLAAGFGLLDLPGALDRLRARSIELTQRSNRLALRLDEEVETSRRQLVDRIQILSTSLMASVEEERCARGELLQLLEREIVARNRPQPAARVGPAAHALPPEFGTLYLAFEEKFRGSSGEIKQRLGVYLEPLERASAGTAERPVLDIGCGRGELIELLLERGWRVSGIDLNPEVVRSCRERGLPVDEGEALTHLRVLPSASLGAVIGLHILEHLGLGAMIELLGEASRVLRPDGIAIFETPNPENVIVGSCNFWLDPTHERPLHPLALKFLAETQGLDAVEVLRLNPMPRDEQVTEGEDSEIVRRFNKYFFGARDVAIIGHKR
jgi:SAM-dependent methyltransferase